MSRQKITLLCMAMIVLWAAVRAAAGDDAKDRAADKEPRSSETAKSAIGNALLLLGSKAAANEGAEEGTREGTKGDVNTEEGRVAARGAGAERRITLQTASTDIGNALRLVAEQGGLNLVIGPRVEGEVSVYLEDVPVGTALKAIAINNGFAYTVEDGVITVSRPREQSKNEEEIIPPIDTQVFTLQWQDAERVKDALEYALTQYGRIKVLNENSDGGYQTTRLSDLSGDIEDSNVKSYTATSGSQAGGALGAGGTATAGGVPRNARKLVVTDTLDNLPRIADLIADLDKMPPQVLIEARIIEMTTDLQRQLGIDWNVDVLANGPVLNHELPLNWRAGFSGGGEIRHSPDGTVQTSTGLALGTIDFSRFTALVRVHQSDNAIRLLANPRLLVFNNHSASILVGERYPLLEANITDEGTLTEAFDTYIPVGIQLEVTPSIMSDGRITMLVHPATSALGDEVVGTTGLRVRRILTREIDTRVIMQDGQTVVLGGLISDRKTRTINKIPGLGDLPILDVLFRQENPASQRVDLLIFLTAHVEHAVEFTERDQKILDMYRPQFKQVDRLQDVQLHFEIPTEYEAPRPMFGDPPVVETDGDLDESASDFEESASDDAVAGWMAEVGIEHSRKTGAASEPGQGEARHYDPKFKLVAPRCSEGRRGGPDQPRNQEAVPTARIEETP
ncbi:MAG: hypothetical protein JXQ75_16060 [Phycisphaerae bacterium]|nr:hypothetical protein [Phycisphaerae bacterium]